MNLEGLFTQTTLTWDEALAQDQLTLNGNAASEAALQRTAQYLNQIRTRYGVQAHAQIESANNFPTGAGIASSASGFAALAVAATAAAGLDLPEHELSALARLGSGSASRSVPSGFVRWQVGQDHASSYADSIAAPNHWELVDLIAIVSQGHKAVGSTEGHALADTSDLQAGRLHHVQARYETCQQAILERDFATFAEVVEQDSNLMHAVMMTSVPPLFYWLPSSIGIMHAVKTWRADGLQVCYTLDAGPNVHCITTAQDAPHVQAKLQTMGGILEIKRANVGGGAQVV
jgi:diphosphomevalonate decarboxylase